MTAHDMILIDFLGAIAVVFGIPMLLTLLVYIIFKGWRK